MSKCGTCGRTLNANVRNRKVDSDGDDLCNRCEDLDETEQENKKDDWEDRDIRQYVWAPA